MSFFYFQKKRTEMVKDVGGSTTSVVYFCPDDAVAAIACPPIAREAVAINSAKMTRQKHM